MEKHSHDEGLRADLALLRRTINRRGACGLIAAAVLAGCGESGGAETQTAGCVAGPRETEGPFPGDGTNRGPGGGAANALAQSGIVRGDIRKSFGATETRAEGLPLSLTLTMANASGCTPLAGHAVYLWHCDREGRYSMYDLPTENYLRGVGVTDAKGEVSFSTIFPGCYPGRFPHMHIEVFKSQDLAGTGKNSVLTSQLVMPGETCAQVYEKAQGYARSVAFFQDMPQPMQDGLFADNTIAQLAAMTPRMTGDPRSGYRGHVTVGVRV